MPIHSAFLKYFDEAHKCGSIRLASRKLHVASSAVNRQILKIEQELEVKLFERSHNGIRLTPAGELLAEHATRTLADAARTLTAIATLRDGAGLGVTITGQESVIAHFLPPALVALHADYPEISTAFKATSGRQLHELLSTGGADIALAFDPEPGGAIEEIARRELPVGAVMTSAHPLADRSQVSLSDCAPYPVILPDQSWPLRDLLDREIARIELELNIITSSNSVEFLRSMLDQQLGIGFQTIVGIEAKVERGDLVHIGLHNPEPITQTFAICVPTGHVASAPIQRVLELLCLRLEEYASIGRQRIR